MNAKDFILSHSGLPVRFIQDDVLEHHGIKGQKKGVRNGPPYPLGSGQKSAAERRQRSSMSENQDSDRDRYPRSKFGMGRYQRKDGGLTWEGQLKYTHWNGELNKAGQRALYDRKGNPKGEAGRLYEAGIRKRDALIQKFDVGSKNPKHLENILAFTDPNRKTDHWEEQARQTVASKFQAEVQKRVGRIGSNGPEGPSAKFVKAVNDFTAYKKSMVERSKKFWDAYLTEVKNGGEDDIAFDKFSKNDLRIRNEYYRKQRVSYDSIVDIYLNELNIPVTKKNHDRMNYALSDSGLVSYMEKGY